MSKAIGGYFELAEREAEGNYPVDGVRLNTSRNALEYIIKCLPDCKHVYLPLYTCEAVVEPFKRLPNVIFSFYHINNRFEIAEEITLHDGEYLIANNYFGLKDAYIAQLAQQYGYRLIVDNAQALFAPVLPGIKAVYSARKYVGVADGGFAVGVEDLDALNYELDDASEHDSHLLIRKEQGAEAGFKDYQQNECKLDNQPIRRMAIQTQDVLLHIEYQNVIAKHCVEAGADVIIGAHPHVLQGIEFIDEKPVFYSLGNYIFNSNIPKTMLVKVVIKADDTVEYSLIPAFATNGQTQVMEGAEAEKLYTYMNEISVKNYVNSDGSVTDKTE